LGHLLLLESALVAIITEHDLLPTNNYLLLVIVSVLTRNQKDQEWVLIFTLEQKHQDSYLLVNLLYKCELELK
jgi:hypothetical protein